VVRLHPLNIIALGYETVRYLRESSRGSELDEKLADLKIKQAGGLAKHVLNTMKQMEGKGGATAGAIASNTTNVGLQSIDNQLAVVQILCELGFEWAGGAGVFLTGGHRYVIRAGNWVNAATDKVAPARIAAAARANAQQLARARQVFAELDQWRKTLPVIGSGTGARPAGVVAALGIDGQTYKGYNGWIGSTGRKLADVMNELRGWGVRSNNQTVTHAEGHVFYQALKAGSKAKSATLYVDSTFCKSCRDGGLRAYAAGLGVKRLTVYIRLPNGHIYSGLYAL
jgi:hypothetical protein